VTAFHSAGLSQGNEMAVVKVPVNLLIRVTRNLPLLFRLGNRTSPRLEHVRGVENCYSKDAVLIKRDDGWHVARGRTVA